MSSHLAGPISESDLWNDWFSHRSKENRSAIFFFYAEWVRVMASMLVSRYPHGLAEWHDYVQLGSIGLLKAIDRFDITIQPSFKAYAEPFVVGEVLRGLACFVRDEKGRRGAAGYRALADEDDAELYSFDEIVDVAIGLAFGAFLEVGISDGSEDNDPLTVYEADRQVDELFSFVERLPDREKKVIVAHYFQYLAFSDIAELLCVSRPRVAQLHKKALQRMREWYEAEKEDEQVFY